MTADPRVEEIKRALNDYYKYLYDTERDALDDVRYLLEKLSELDGENKRLKEYKDMVYSGAFETRILELESQVAALRKALVPFATDYFSNRKEAELNKIETRHHGGSAYDACVYFEDVQRAREALDAAGKRVEVNVINKEKK